MNHVHHISLEPHPVRWLKGVLLSYFFKVSLVPIVTFLIGVNLYDHHQRVACPHRRQLLQVFTKIDLLLRDMVKPATSSGVSNSTEISDATLDIAFS